MHYLKALLICHHLLNTIPVETQKLRVHLVLDTLEGLDNIKSRECSDLIYLMGEGVVRLIDNNKIFY